MSKIKCMSDSTLCSQKQNFFIHRGIMLSRIFTAVEVVHDEGLTEKLENTIKK